MKSRLARRISNDECVSMKLHGNDVGNCRFYGKDPCTCEISPCRSQAFINAESEGCKFPKMAQRARICARLCSRDISFSSPKFRVKESIRNYPYIWKAGNDINTALNLDTRCADIYRRIKFSLAIHGSFHETFHGCF